MKYGIDYRQGGMGNTILSHVLYSCNKVDLDLADFFSDSGNAHNISKFNNTNLTANHLLEFPNSDIICIIELYSDNWNLVLQYCMSYNKWHGFFPTLENYTKMFKVVSVYHDDWKDYYSVVKDPSWPECSSYSNIQYLPKVIQEEIYQNYKIPSALKVNDNNRLLEFLSICYFDLINMNFYNQFSDSVRYPLSKYFNNDIEILKNKIQEILGWEWDQTKSDKFQLSVLNQNSKYFLWLYKIKNIYNQTVNFYEQDIDLEIWESAIVIAKVCCYFNITPSMLDWNNQGRFLEHNNVQLIKSLKKANHGKTI